MSLKYLFTKPLKTLGKSSKDAPGRMLFLILPLKNQ